VRWQLADSIALTWVQCVWQTEASTIAVQGPGLRPIATIYEANSARCDWATGSFCCKFQLTRLTRCGLHPKPCRTLQIIAASAVRTSAGRHFYAQPVECAPKQPCGVTGLQVRFRVVSALPAFGSACVQSHWLCPRLLLAWERQTPKRMPFLDAARPMNGFTKSVLPSSQRLDLLRGTIGPAHQTSV